MSSCLEKLYSDVAVFCLTTTDENQLKVVGCWCTEVPSVCCQHGLEKEFIRSKRARGVTAVSEFLYLVHTDI